MAANLFFVCPITHAADGFRPTAHYASFVIRHRTHPYRKRAWAIGPAVFPRRPYVHSGRRPKPDVGNLLGTGACAFTGKPAGHARMPPGLRNASVTELPKEVSTPHAAAFTQRTPSVRGVAGEGKEWPKPSCRHRFSSYFVGANASVLPSTQVAQCRVCVWLDVEWTQIQASNAARANRDQTFIHQPRKLVASQIGCRRSLTRIALWQGREGNIKYRRQQTYRLCIGRHADDVIPSPTTARSGRQPFV